MKISIVAALICFLVYSLLTATLHAQCCLKYSDDSTRCVQCPPAMRLFKGHCLFQIQNCKQYSNSVQCANCTQGYITTSDGYCEKSETISGLSKNFIDELIPNSEDNENILILGDYSMSLYPQLQNSQIKQAFIRTFKNGTAFTIIHFKNKGSYYEVAASFKDDVPFLFEFIYFQEYDQKPGIFPENDSNSSQDNNSNNNNNDNSGPQYGETILNYKFLSKNQRDNDEGCLAIDKLLRRQYAQQLGNNPIIIAAYQRIKGYFGEYIVFYETTNKKLIYENKSVYNFARGKTFILSFTETYLRK